jgi:phosphoserine phosphatase
MLRSVYFDCDSTLSAIEGIDEILASAGEAVRHEVAELTRRAMDGDIPLADVYERRLLLLRPSRQQLDAVAARYVARAVPDARAVVAALQGLGKTVGIVSGGLLPPVAHLAAWLGIDARDVYAVPVSFDASGAYVDFAREPPLWRNGGKIDVLAALPRDHHPLAFVGDGVTDLETQGHVARFVGYGGVVQRARVAAEAERFVASASLAGVLPHVTTEDERRRLAAEPRFARLLSAAES